MSSTLKDAAAIVGIGQTPFTKNSGVSELQLASECVAAAIAEAGLAPGDVDGLVRTMYLVEGGAASQDPEYADVLEHCRIMVLAFTGQDEALGELLAVEVRDDAETIGEVEDVWPDGSDVDLVGALGSGFDVGGGLAVEAVAVAGEDAFGALVRLH